MYLDAYDGDGLGEKLKDTHGAASKSKSKPDSESDSLEQEFA